MAQAHSNFECAQPKMFADGGCGMLERVAPANTKCLRMEPVRTQDGNIRRPIYSNMFFDLIREYG